MPVDLETTNYDVSPGLFETLRDQFTADAWLYLPEGSLVLTILALFLVTLVVPRRGQKHMAWLAVLGLLATLFSLFAVASHEPALLFQGMVAHDSFAVYFKAIFVLSTLAVVFLSYLDRGLDGLPMGEYYALLLTSVLGMFLLASATDILMLFIGLEAVSIPTYILVVYRKQRKDSAEAALKYVVYGSVAGAVMIYGLSLFYGFTGSTSLAALSSLSAVGGVNEAVLVIAGVLVFAGFAYKISAVPMHFWAPDIYQGAPTAVTAFLSVGSKAAGFAGLMRLLYSMNMGVGLVDVEQAAHHLDWITILSVVSAVSMTFGNLAAIFQTNVKRMLAYSSIAHAGYILMGVSAIQGGYADAAQAVGFYFLAFLFMNLGAFAVVILFANRLGSESIDDYKGLGARAPLAAVSLTICLLSLVGIPPTGGFVGKLLLFQVAIDQSMYWLAVVAGANTAVSVYYYIRIVKNMFLEKGEEGAPALALPALGNAVVLVLTAGVVLLGTFFAPAARWVKGVAVEMPERSAPRGVAEASADSPPSAQE